MERLRPVQEPWEPLEPLEINDARMSLWTEDRAAANFADPELSRRLLDGHLCTLSMPWGYYPGYDDGDGHAEDEERLCPVCARGSGIHEASCAWLNSARACGIA